MSNFSEEYRELIRKLGLDPYDCTELDITLALLEEVGLLKKRIALLERGPTARRGKAPR